MTISKHTTPDGIEICYEIFGKENNDQPIVLISGAGLQMLNWADEFCTLLSKSGNRVIRFDNRDTGESSILDHLPTPAPWRFTLRHKLGFKVSSPYSLEDMATDLIHLLDGLDISVNGVFGCDSRNCINTGLNFLPVLGFEPGLPVFHREPGTDRGNFVFFID